MSFHAGSRLIDPHLLHQKAGIFSGAHIAVFGAGRTGHMVFPAALSVGSHGSVYAVDILKEVLLEIDKRARLDGLHQIHTVWSDVERVGKTHIPEHQLSAVFIVNLLSKMSLPKEVLQEAERLLADKSRLVIVDWNMESTLPFAPAKEKRIRMQDIAELAKPIGFAVQEFFSAGDHHDGVVLYLSR